MTTMKNQVAIAVTVGVWVAAFGSAAALTFDLNHALRWASPPSQPTALTQAECPAQVEPGSEAQAVLYIPALTIVGHAPRDPEAAQGPKAP
jgi:hypothetical protein